MKSKSVAVRLLALMTIIVFTTELGIMLFLGRALSELTPLSIGLIDSLILTGLLFPVLFFLVFRPLSESIAIRERAEDSLREAYTAVERQVEERTAELAGANERLRSEVGRREQAQELSEALNGIDALVGSTFNFGEVLGPAMAESTERLGCDASAVFLRENGQWVLSHALGLPGVRPGARVALDEAKCAVKAIETRQIFISHDAFNDERLDRNYVRERGIRSFIASPMITRGRVVGAIDFYRTGTAEAFSTAQIDFANKLSTSISMARESAGLYAAQLNIADTLQEALLMVSEEMAGIESAHVYRSTTLDPAKAGGDFFDLFELEHDRVGIIIGDVSGKGLEAATLTSLVKNTIRAYAYEHGSAAEVVGMTNDVLVKVSAPAVFATLFFGILQTKSGLLTYCTAGHPPAILKKGRGRAALLETRSPAIGVVNEFEFVEDEETIDQGDVLVLYTDGVTEARCGPDFFGREALLRCVIRNEGTVKMIPEQVLEELTDRRGCILPDDIAILALSLRES